MKKIILLLVSCSIFSSSNSHAVGFQDLPATLANRILSKELQGKELGYSSTVCRTWKRKIMNTKDYIKWKRVYKQLNAIRGLLEDHVQLADPIRWIISLQYSLSNLKFEMKSLPENKFVQNQDLRKTFNTLMDGIFAAAINFPFSEKQFVFRALIDMKEVSTEILDRIYTEIRQQPVDIETLQLLASNSNLREEIFHGLWNHFCLTYGIPNYKFISKASQNQNLTVEQAAFVINIIRLQELDDNLPYQREILQALSGNKTAVSIFGNEIMNMVLRLPRHDFNRITALEKMIYNPGSSNELLNRILNLAIWEYKTYDGEHDQDESQSLINIFAKSQINKHFFLAHLENITKEFPENDQYKLLATILESEFINLHDTGSGNWLSETFDSNKLAYIFNLVKQWKNPHFQYAIVNQLIQFIKRSQPLITDAINILSKTPDPNQRCSSFLSLLTTCKVNRDQAKMIWDNSHEIDSKDLNLYICLLLSVSCGLSEKESFWFFQKARQISLENCDYHWNPFPEE